MVDFEQKITKLEVELSSIKERIHFLSIVYEKFDSTLEKIEVIIEDRRENTQTEVKDLYKKLEELQRNLLVEIATLRREVSTLHDSHANKIDDLDKWRWIIIGAAGLVAWILSKLSNMVNLH